MKLNNPLKYAFIIGLIGILILCLVIYVERKTISINNENQARIALAEHLKSNSTKAHLWFEEAMGGNKSIVLEKDVYGFLDSSVKILKAVLDGGETDLGVFYKTTDYEIIKIINQSLLNCKEFKLLAQQRMDSKIESLSHKSKINSRAETFMTHGEEIGGPLDQAFDASIEKLQGNYDRLDKHIKMKIAHDNTMLYSLFWTSILLIFIVFTVFSFLLYRILKNESLAKEALMLSEKRFRTIFEEAPMGIALIDSHTGVMHNVNPKYLEIIGRSKEEINNIDWMSITHPDDLQEGLVNKALINEKKSKGFKMSKRYIRPDGSIVWVDMAIASLETKDKANSRNLCMVEDITERKRIEDALKSSENELLGMFACMDDLIFELSSDGIYLKIAPTNPALLYKPADNLLGKRVNEVFPEKESNELISKINLALKDKKIFHLEYSLSINNELLTFEATVSPLTENSVLCIARDITARKKIQDEIITSQKNFEEAEKLAKIGSWEFNISTLEIKWSKGHYLLFELENQPSDILYGTYRSACHPDDFQLIDDMRENAIKTGEGFNYEYRIIGNNGNIKNISCTGEVIKNAEGQVIGLKGTGQDITARKKLEILLKAKEQNALLIRHAAQVPGVIYQYQIYPDGRFLFPFVSEGVWDLGGITAEEAMKDGLKVFNLVHPDDLEGLRSTLHVSIIPKESWTHEFRINSPLKGIRWVRGNSKPEELADGSVLWHGYFADITESKQAEEALQISKDKLEAVFNGSNDAIMLSTRKGFFDCNPKTLEMFGLSDKKEFTASHRADFSPALQPDGQVSLNKAIAMIEIAYEKGTNRFEWVHQKMNGETFSAEIVMSAFNYGNERVLQTTVQDITERKKAEERLIESEALLSSILQTLPVAVFCKDVKNDFQYTLWNKKAEDIFGIKAEDCIGKDDYNFFGKESADFYRKYDVEASKMKGILDVPEEIVESNNKRVIIHTQKTIVRDNKGTPHFLLGVSEDITERKKAEEKIKASEEKYRSVVENAADVIITIDNSSIIQFINHTPSGAPIDKVMLTSIYNYLPKEYHELAKQRFKKIYDSKKSTIYEMPGLHLDGSLVWFSINVSPVFSGEEVIGITLIIRDLTERKKAEEIIKKSEEKYRSVVENAADIIINLDSDHKIQFINHTHIGAPIDRVMKTSIFNYVPKEYQELVKHQLEKIYESKKPTANELPGQHLDGSIAWFSINAGPIFSGNEVTGVTLIIRDITERRKAEEKIKASEEKYRSVVENAADMIITFDRDNKIQFINHLRQNTPREHVIGTSIFSLIPEAYQGHVKQKIKDVFEEKKPQNYELQVQHLDGSSAWYSTNMGPMFSGDEVTGITLITRDITESKKAEEEIQQSLKEKEVLLKEVHHRVKNNLQIILSILNLQYSNITDKKTLDLLRDIRSRIKAMSFIHELLYQTNDFSSINFSEYISAITSNLVYSYTQNQTIDLKLEIGTLFLDLDRAIPCGLIINEIVTNALKYAFPDQQKGEVYISLTQNNEFIQLIIADNGKGFPNNLDYRKTESLGMQLVLTLVEQLRGEISLDNSNGAKYTITFKDGK